MLMRLLELQPMMSGSLKVYHFAKVFAILGFGNIIE